MDREGGQELEMRSGCGEEEEARLRGHKFEFGGVRGVEDVGYVCS